MNEKPLTFSWVGDSKSICQFIYNSLGKQERERIDIISENLKQIMGNICKATTLGAVDTYQSMKRLLMRTLTNVVW